MPNIMRLIESNGRTIHRRSRSPVETRSKRSRTSSSRLNQSRTEIATDRLRKRALKNQEKPAELFSTQCDLVVFLFIYFLIAYIHYHLLNLFNRFVSEMKLHDSTILAGDEFISITDQWRREWERGVQVTVNPTTPNQYFKIMYKN